MRNMKKHQNLKNHLQHQTKNLDFAKTFPPKKRSFVDFVLMCEVRRRHRPF